MDDPSAKRLDYVFVNEDRVTVRDCAVVFTEPIPHLGCSYSDHFGINVKLELQGLIKDGSQATVSDESILSHAIFDTIDRISDRYLAREIRHSRYRNIHFIASVVVFLGLLIGQWWVTPIYGHFIILVCGVLIMVTGTVNGLIGFIFGRWEIRALREFMSEVRLARKVYSRN
jgi:sphingomyelin phosphodiesterase 2